MALSSKKGLTVWPKVTASPPNPPHPTPPGPTPPHLSTTPPHCTAPPPHTPPPSPPPTTPSPHPPPTRPPHCCFVAQSVNVTQVCCACRVKQWLGQQRQQQQQLRQLAEQQHGGIFRLSHLIPRAHCRRTGHQPLLLAQAHQEVPWWLLLCLPQVLPNGLLWKDRKCPALVWLIMTWNAF